MVIRNSAATADNKAKSKNMQSYQQSNQLSVWNSELNDASSYLGMDNNGHAGFMSEPDVGHKDNRFKRPLIKAQAAIDNRVSGDVSRQ